MHAQALKHIRKALTTSLIIILCAANFLSTGNWATDYMANDIDMKKLKKTIFSKFESNEFNSECSGIDTTEIQNHQPEAEWTFFCYLDADNDLEREGFADLDEIKSVGSTDDVNILVLFDGWSQGDTHFYYVEREHLLEIPLSTIDNNWSDEVNMGASETFIKTAKWVFTNYRAQKYFVVFWDHGGGDGGVCWDETDGNDYLNMSELRTILYELSTYLKKPVDGVGFDACLMSTVEVIYQIKAYVNVVVASEETVPGDGWPYNSSYGGNVLGNLINHPEWRVEDFAYDIVEQYRLRYSDVWYYGVTMAAINVTEFDYLLIPSLNVFVQKLKHRAGTYTSSIQDARDATESYYDDFIDLYHFTENIMARISDSDIQHAGLELNINITRTMINEWHNFLCPNAHGISLHFSTAYSAEYDSLWLAKETQVDEFFKAFYLSSDIPNQEPTCIIISPANGSAFDLKQSVEIAGTSSDSDGILKVEIKINRGDWFVAQGTELWNYTIPPYFLTEGTYTIWARALDNRGFSDVDKDFSVYQKISLALLKGPEACLTIPAGGERWYSNKVHTIAWNVSGKAPFTIDLYISVDNGRMYSLIEAGLVQTIEGSANYDWLVNITGINSDMCRIKMNFTDSMGLNVTLISNIFSIAKQLEIKFITPAHHTYLYANETYLIKWNATGGYPPYQIELYVLSANGIDYEKIYTTVQNNEGVHSYLWYVDLQNVSISQSTRFKLILIDSNSQTVSENSTAFKIVLLPDVYIIKPTSIDIWYAGKEQLIEWYIEGGVPPYDIVVKHSLDGGLTYAYLNQTLQSEEGYGHMTINTVDYTTQLLKLQIIVCDFFNHTATATTDNFTIVEDLKIQIITPQEGMYYYASTDINISFNITGGFGNITTDIYYSKTGGRSWELIVKDINTAFYRWYLPPIHCKCVLIKIFSTDSYNASATATSGNFTIWYKTTVIQGIVLDNRTHKPIADANVLLVELNIRCITGENGSFIFFNILLPKPFERWKYSLNITKEGYEYKNITVAVNSSSGKIYITILLNPTYPHILHIKIDVLWLSLIILIICIAVVVTILLLRKRRKDRVKEEILKVSYPQDLIALRKYLYKQSSPPPPPQPQRKDK